MRSNPPHRKHWHSPLSLALLCALVCVLGGCARPSAVVIPPCPVPTEAAIDGLVAIEGEPLEQYVAEVERYCEAIEELR